MQTPAQILERLKPLSSIEGYDTVDRFLRDPGTYLEESKSDGRVTVKMVDHAWGTRLQIARKKGLRPLPGCEHLVQSLARLPDAMILKVVILLGTSMIGAVWFIEENQEPVGFVVGELTTL
ncbi:hypothetical protein SAMN05216548_108197 [Faunimonas pinastri]|uniref:Uncharacterized protein n=1 Tax=Faunimonas pinastri TaxID=1855383 RepID=A0A1H9JNA9_9HYPH|nr:hypothetical protein [Faunimonas pinastri]SEQ88411.1 hypothetical protein SAMN05216548_108197 [Faunimonas pinastri]